MEINDELVAKQMSDAFMGFSIYDDTLIPVYDLNACLEKMATDGLTEEQAVAIISGDGWIKKFGCVKPIFWIGHPQIQQQSIH